MNDIKLINKAIDCIRCFCRKQRSCADCPIFSGDKYYPCLFRDGIAPAHLRNAKIVNHKKEASRGTNKQLNK